MQPDRKITAEAAQITELLGDIWGLATLNARTKADLPALAPTQARSLHIITAADGITPADLAAQMNMSRPMISEIIRKLEANELIMREKSPTDGRSVVIKPTERGLYVQRHFHLGVTESFAEALSDMPYAEVAPLLSALPALAALRDKMASRQ